MKFSRLSYEINKILKEEEERVEKAIDKVTKKVKNNSVKEVALKSPINPKSRKERHYKDEWTSRVKKGRLVRDVTIHNKQYQLTHLLENGHFSFNQHGGAYGYVKARPHIAPVQEKIDKTFQEELIKELKL
ncbi:MULTISPECIES: hypothetical protein [Helcococcus]|uniref:HK97 gp10 family phage protein n=1 Tax=Helcococcus bovis TaxID=3153252 RepID=A0ABW9F7M0_9FIRM